MSRTTIYLNDSDVEIVRLLKDNNPSFNLSSFTRESIAKELNKQIESGNYIFEKLDKETITMSRTKYELVEYNNKILNNVILNNLVHSKISTFIIKINLIIKTDFNLNFC